MAENVFEAVKQSVSTREAAEFYGIKVSRTGMACCPFHDDKNPSMKVDQRFHCFGCGEDGDVIDFTAKLFDLSPKEAAEKLAQDFGLIYDSQAPPRRRYVRQKTEAQKFREDRQRCYRVLSDYYYLLKKWEADCSPRTPEEEPHPRFVEAIQKKAYVEYLLDLFLYESEEEQKAWIAEHTAEITHLERRLKIMAENKPTNRERLREITDGIEQGIKELFESEKYMRYLSVMSRFHRYSVNNTMLIYMQKPDATLVAGYNKWKDQFERHVKKGEHGITIIAPTPYKKKIKGFESDLEVLAAHPHPEDGFAGMEIRGDLLTDKENAGAALLDACKEVKTSDPVQIGSYRGYAMSVEFSAWKQEYTLLLKGQMTHRATLGTDPRGNLTRIDNALAQMPQRLEAAKAQLDNLYQQQAAAKEEVGKPFLYEEELKSKNARLVELDTLLNIDGKGQAHTESAVAKSTRPSVLDHLKRPVQPRSTDKKPKQHEEVR